jgi:hypothetical protein
MPNRSGLERVWSQCCPFSRLVPLVEDGVSRCMIIFWLRAQASGPSSQVQQRPAADGETNEDVKVIAVLTCESINAVWSEVPRGGHNAWAVHPMIYKMMDGSIPFFLRLGASHDISPPPLKGKYCWNVIELDYHYPYSRLELRGGGADEEALVRLIRGQTFWVPTSGGEMVAGISPNPASSVWDGCGPDLSSFSSSRQSSALVASISAFALASIQSTAADGSVRAMPDGDVPVVAEWSVKPALIPGDAEADLVLIAVLESATGTVAAPLRRSHRLADQIQTVRAEDCLRSACTGTAICHGSPAGGSCGLAGGSGDADGSLQTHDLSAGLSASIAALEAGASGNPRIHAGLAALEARFEITEDADRLEKATAIKKQLKRMKPDAAEAYLDPTRTETEDQAGMCAVVADLESLLQKSKDMDYMEGFLVVDKQPDVFAESVVVTDAEGSVRASPDTPDADVVIPEPGDMELERRPEVSVNYVLVDELDRIAQTTDLLEEVWHRRCLSADLLKRVVRLTGPRWRAAAKFDMRRELKVRASEHADLTWTCECGHVVIPDFRRHCRVSYDRRR